MNTPESSVGQTDRPSRDASLWRRGVRAGIVSSVVNSMIYVGAVLAGVFPHILKVDPTEPGMTVVAVVLVSMAASLGGVGVWKVVGRFADRPLTPYLWLAGIVLVLSFAAPYAVPGTTGAQALVQNVLHVVVAAAVVWEVWRLSRRRLGRAEGPLAAAG